MNTQEASRLNVGRITDTVNGFQFLAVIEPTIGRPVFDHARRGQRVEAGNVL